MRENFLAYKGSAYHIRIFIYKKRLKISPFGAAFSSG